jgi:glycosyltransferase involved in cell wall biosynthesis
MNIGLIHRNLNLCTGREFVGLCVLQALRLLSTKVVVISQEGIDKSRILRNFGLNIDLDGVITIPLWSDRIRTYFDFLVPILAKPICDVIVNVDSSDFLPWVDVTYVHYPQPMILDDKGKLQKLWRGCYAPYQLLERAIGLRSSGKLVLANSKFTQMAVRKRYFVDPTVIYPPVDISGVMNSELDVPKRDLVVTVSRFSPEKRLELIPLLASKVDAIFVVLGPISVRSSYNEMHRLIREYGVRDKVKLMTDASVCEKVSSLKKAKVYLHTMPSEHFGVSIVEAMAAGCIPVVHDSGGPREFVPRVWRYRDVEEAEQKIKEALFSWSPGLSKDMQAIAYGFRVERFQQEFLAHLNSYLASRFQ